MNDLIPTLLTETLVPILAALVLAAIGWASTTAVTYLKSRTKALGSGLLRNALEQLIDAAALAVAETSQVAVDELKIAAKDGKLSKDEAAAALNNATKRAWEILGPELRQILLGIFGGDEQATLEGLVKPAIEAAVRRQDEPRKEAPADPEVAQREAALARARLGLR